MAKHQRQQWIWGTKSTSKIQNLIHILLETNISPSKTCSNVWRWFSRWNPWDMFFPSLEGSLIFGNFMEKSFVISTDRADRVSSTISTWFARFLNHRRYPTNLRSVKWVYGAQTRSSKLEFLKVGKMNDFHPSTKFTFFWVKKVRRLPMLNQTNSHMTYPP